MTEQHMRQSLESLRADLAAYGARLGIVEPCLHRAMTAKPLIEEVMAELRAAKDYAKSDKLRQALAHMKAGAGYAFPNRYKSEVTA